MYKKFVKKENKAPVENIKSFDNHKQLYLLTKAHSPQTTVFVEDMNDDWFVYVITYRTKSGVITDKSLIIKSDCNNRLRHLISLGHELKK